MGSWAPTRRKQSSRANNGEHRLLLSWCTAAWEVWWTSRPHAPPQHIDPHHVTKECSASFVLASTALMALRAILHTTEWWLAWHFTFPFSPPLGIAPQIGFARQPSPASFKSLQTPLKPFSPDAGTQTNGIIWVSVTLGDSTPPPFFFFFLYLRFCEMAKTKGRPIEAHLCWRAE